jgi:alcohol dehydrogenase class IV
MVIANTGTVAVHSMGNPLTYFRHIDHGRANALLLTAFLDFADERHHDKIQDILACCRVSSISELSSMINGLLGEKETLSGEEIELFTSIAAKAGNIRNGIAAPDEKAIAQIYARSMAQR